MVPVRAGLHPGGFTLTKPWDGYYRVTNGGTEARTCSFCPRPRPAQCSSLNRVLYVTRPSPATKPVSSRCLVWRTDPGGCGLGGGPEASCVWEQGAGEVGWEG